MAMGSSTTALWHESAPQLRSNLPHELHHRCGCNGFRGADLILWLIACGFCLVVGMLIGEGKVAKRVRGAAGKARDAVFGSRPAPPVSAKDAFDPRRATNDTDVFLAPEVSPTPPKNPIRAGQALKNIFAFFVGLIGWAAKNPVAVLAIAVLALWLTVGASCSGPFGKSRDALRLEREIAEREAQFQETLRERDEAITAIRTETARTLQQIRLESQRGHDAIAAATPEHEEEIDPALVAAFRDALDGLCVPRADGTRADTCRS